MKQSFLVISLVAFLTLGLSARAWSEETTFPIIGFGDPTLSAQVTFAYDAQTIQIGILNTSDKSIHPDSRITAFAFNLPEGVSVSPIAYSGGWNIINKSNAIDTPGLFGYFDVAGITGPNFNGGNPNYGIGGPNEYMTFTIYLTALTTLDDILGNGNSSYDPPRNPKEYVQYFIVRFQRTGLDGEGSDVAIPEPTEDPEEFPGGDPV